MSEKNTSKEYDLERFVQAQESRYGGYETALLEIRRGRKQSHWIWYIFPQLKGLGHSSVSQRYGIDGMAEAKAYIAHPLLRAHLIEISEALLSLPESDPFKVMGPPDDLKLQSCMTLFGEAAPEIEVFRKVLDKYYGGQKDKKTLRLLGLSASGSL